jgi:hypothetical protein
MRSLLRYVLLASLVAGTPGPATAAAEDRSPNLTVETRLPYAGGTELTTDGRYVYAGQWNGRTDRDQLPKQGGVRIFDTQATPPKLVGTIKCAGTDMDVAVVRPGVLAVAHHRSTCGVAKNGVEIYDVSNPARPRRTAGIAVASAHTLTAVPGTNYVYVSPGGLGNGNGVTTVLDVTNAAKPKVATLLRPDFDGCHDVTFSRTPLGRLLGACTGYGGIHLWDLTNPLVPLSLSTVERSQNPAIQFAHGSAISDDGALLVVNDEAFYYHQCRGQTELGYGALHVYDITDPKLPRLLGSIASPRGARAESEPYGHVDTWCTSHQLNFIPKTRRLVNAWFTGGVSVWDLTVPTKPREEAHYVGAGAIVWTAHWINDRVWVNDMSRGLEVLKLSLLPTGGPLAPVAPTWTPAALMPASRTPFEIPPGLRYACPVPQA